MGVQVKCLFKTISSPLYVYSLSHTHTLYHSAACWTKHRSWEHCRTISFHFECAGAVILTKTASQHPNCITWSILVPNLLCFQFGKDAGGSLLPLKAWRACGRWPWLTQLEPCWGQIPRECLLSSLHWERNRETAHCGNTVQQTAQSAGKI